MSASQKQNSGLPPITLKIAGVAVVLGLFAFFYFGSSEKEEPGTRFRSQGSDLGITDMEPSGDIQNSKPTFSFTDNNPTGSTYQFEVFDITDGSAVPQVATVDWAPAKAELTYSDYIIGVVGLPPGLPGPGDPTVNEPFVARRTYKWVLHKDGSVVESVFRVIPRDDWAQVSAIQGGPNPREAHQIVFDSTRNKFILYGGQQGRTFFDDIWEYDVVANSWNQVDHKDDPQNVGQELQPFIGYPGGLTEYSAAFDRGRAVIYFFGGKEANQNASGKLWAYYTGDRPDGLKWRLLSNNDPNGPEPRTGAGMVYDATDRKIYVYGGMRGLSSMYDDFWEYSVDTGVWTQLPSAGGPGAVSDFAMALMPDFRAPYPNFDYKSRKIILHGGNTGGSNLSDQTWEYDIDNRSWRKRAMAPGPRPGARYKHELVYDADRKVFYMFGGNENVTTTEPARDDVWSYHPHRDAWERVGNTAQQKPDGRHSFGMAYASGLGSMFIFGGDDGEDNKLDDTWTYTPIESCPKIWLAGYGGTNLDANGGTLEIMAMPGPSGTLEAEAVKVYHGGILMDIPLKEPKQASENYYTAELPLGSGLNGGLILLEMAATNNAGSSCAYWPYLNVTN